MFISINALITLSSLFLLSDGIKVSPTCDMNQCDGYYQLQMHNIKKPNIEITRTKVKITEGMSDMKLAYVKRRWLTIYCYDGSSIDPNTGCYESIETVNPTCSELKEWVKTDVCPTGWECRPDGACTGSQANKKCFDKTTMISNKGPKTLKWEGSRYMLFPMHTCTSSWECNTFTNDVPIFAKFNEQGHLEWVFYDKDNREHGINMNSMTNGIRTPNDELLCPIEENREPLIYIEDAECYAESRDNIKCLIKGDSHMSGTVFDVSGTRGGVLRNMMIEVIGPLLVPADGKIVDLNNYKAEGLSNMPTTLLDRQRAVNVETAHELAINANILQMQSLYNILSLGQEIDELYNIIVNIIKSQSIDDPMLLSKVMRLPNFAVKWDNEEIFEKCKCIRSDNNKNSNCVEGKIFSYGSHIEAVDNSKCFHIPDDIIQQVSLINKTSLHSDYIKYLLPQTASSDSAAWDALNDYRNTLIGGDHTSHSYNNLKDTIMEIQNELSLGQLSKWFSYATYAIAWLTFFMVICILRK